VLVNGFAGPTFRHRRGLRQGDPLSLLLFVLVMDILAHMFQAAEQASVLMELTTLGLKHRVSLYADDIVVFARPSEEELVVVREILVCFGAASGPEVNFAKISIAPIRCSEDLIAEIAPVLQCPTRPLLCTYPRLPLFVHVLIKAELQPILDKLANKLGFWKAMLLSRDGRVAYVHQVMTSSVVYQLMPLDLPLWFLKEAERLLHGFLWTGKEETRSSICVIVWAKVCQPKALGGLGFHNLRYLNAAMHARWVWFQKTDSTKPWSGLHFKVLPEALAIFNVSV
jgi:hypothetical protein